MAKAGKTRDAREDENSIPFLVKLSILNASGRGGDPKDLEDDTDLSDLLTRQEHFVQLRAFLLAVIKQANPAGTISVDEIEGCSIVEDVIDLVIQKIS